MKLVRPIGAVVALSTLVAAGSFTMAAGDLPLYFEPNRGQAEPSAEFVVRTREYNLLLERGAFEMDLGDSSIRVEWLGSDESARPKGIRRSEGRSNYFIGSRPENWLTDIPHFAGVRYETIYPGIDLVFYGSGGRVEYDLIVAPHVDPGQIRLELHGATRTEIGSNGDLLLHSTEGYVRMRAPLVYQRRAGATNRVDAAYQLGEDGLVAFRMGDYEPADTVVIDPLLGYSTYLGGSAPDWAFGIDVDKFGQVYLTGRTFSLDFPGSANVAGGGQDVFVTRLNQDGSGVLYTTYLGGTGPETGFDIAVDGAGNAYVVGTTFSPDFPTLNALLPLYGGDGCLPNPQLDCTDAFVARLSPTGQVLYATYLGGFGIDEGNAIAVDDAGNTWIAGNTSSPNFPVLNAFKPSLPVGAQRSGFVTKFNPDGTAFAYSTYLGGAAFSTANDIAVDAAGSAYVVGSTNGINFPLEQPFQGSLSGTSDAFVSKLDPTGAALSYSTYFGGNDFDTGAGIAVDGDGNAYVTGRVSSTDLPLETPIQATLLGIEDAFVSKFDASGAALVYSTYLGGTGGQNESGQAIAVDDAGNAYVTGQTRSTDFPELDRIAGPCAAMAFNQGSFVSKIKAAGDGFEYSSCIFGSSGDVAQSIALDPQGNAYLTGTTLSVDFPLENPLQGQINGSQDAFVMKVGNGRLPEPVPSVSGLGIGALVLTLLALTGVRMRRRR